jgi:hypothetical protein
VIFEESTRRRNELAARNLNAVTQGIDISMAKMREDIVYEFDAYGNQRYL